MSRPHTDAALDAILALQLTIAWAGEARSTPPRLGWWDTDLVSEDGGGDLLARLAPRTHAWASLEAVREAARRVDAKARARLATPDRLRTLYFFGFELDEQLGDRLAELKRAGRPPAEALRLPTELGASFSADELAELLGARGAASYETMPGGRKLRGARPEAPEAMAERLAAALVPFAPEYPLPYYELDGAKP